MATSATTCYLIHHGINEPIACVTMGQLRFYIANGLKVQGGELWLHGLKQDDVLDDAALVVGAYYRLVDPQDTVAGTFFACIPC